MSEVVRLSCLIRLCSMNSESGKFEQAKAYFEEHEDVKALNHEQRKEFMREVGILFRG